MLTQSNIQTSPDIRLIHLQQQILQMKMTIEESNYQKINLIYQEIIQLVADTGQSPSFSFQWFIDGRVKPSIFTNDFLQKLLQHFILIHESNQIRQFNVELQKLMINQFQIISLAQAQNDLIRNMKCIGVLLKILKIQMEIIQKITPQEVACLRNLSICMAYITTNRKNAEYLSIKRGQSLFQILISGSTDQDTVNASYAVLANSCMNEDQKLLLWSNGTFTKTLNDHKNVSALWLILKIIYDNQESCDEIVDYLFSRNGEELLEQLKFSIINKDSFLPVSLAIIRKVSEMNKQMRDYFVNYKITHLLCLQSKFLTEHEYQCYLFVLKELFSFIGLVCIHNNQFIESQPQRFYSTFFEILNSLSDLRVLKTGIGCLTNMSSNFACLSNFIGSTELLSLIQNILDKNIDNQQIMFYALKLINNCTKNQTVVMLISQPKYLMKFLYIQVVKPSNLGMMNLVVKIFKQSQFSNHRVFSIDIIKKFFDQLLLCLQELESSDNDFNYINIICDSIEFQLEQQKLEYIGETIIFLSQLSSHSKKYNLMITTSQQLKKFCYQYINSMKLLGDQYFKKSMQNVSCLPIEEMGLEL